MSLTIRAYNVRFGDAILVSLGAGAAAKHVLFDFGNAPGGVKSGGGRNDVFEAIAQELRDRTTHGLGSGVKVEILAPEDDASVYYPKRGKLLLDAAAGLGAPQTTRRGRTQRRSSLPTNMARDEFEQLKDDIAEIDLATVFALDKAENNTSLVVRLTVGGKVLMFCGDAEVESWRIMKEKGLLAPVDVLKVAHHGSVNGMPFDGDDDGPCR